MCGVIVVVAGRSRSTCRGRMPIYMIIPRYSHNYAQFCQLLNSNLFTHCKYLCSWEKPLVKPMAPGSISIILIYYYLVISFAIYFAFILFCIFIIKIPKNIILSYLSDLTLISGRVGINNPLSRWLRGFICLCRCERLVRGLLLDWYLGSQNWGKYLRYFAASPFPLQGKTNAVLKR